LESLDYEVSSRSVEQAIAMKADFEARVKAVQWSGYLHPRMQDQSLIPGLLLEMALGTQEEMLKAAERLWNVAAHQGCSGPSAVPVTEFLVEMLEELPPSVQVENLDTLYQFSICLTGKNWRQWSAELRTVFLKALPLLKRLRRTSNEDVADFCSMIIQNIQGTEQPRAESGASTNGGPARRIGNSEVGDGPPTGG
jgi:hypothetical protein